MYSSCVRLQTERERGRESRW